MIAMSDVPAGNPAVRSPLLFDAVLRPYRSLSPAGFWLLMAAIAVVSFTAGIAFFLAGAWPVVGFLGLDVVLIYIAFRQNYRSGLLHETIQLSATELTIHRVSPYGRINTWIFQPYWLRVRIDDPPGHSSPLTLTSHGRQITIGAFLTADERLEVAYALKAALANVQAVPQV